MTKRRPARFTAITPGLARSVTRCGKRSVSPLAWRSSETGAQKKFAAMTWPLAAPTASPRRRAAPSLLGGDMVRCGASLGGRLAAAMAPAANPPMAQTTPPRARIRWLRPSRFTTTPVTAPCSTISSCASLFSHSSAPLPKALVARRAISALPVVRRVPRWWERRSRP
ncbi:hypothetical protein D3C76_1073780 [compost metagenome]